MESIVDFVFEPKVTMEESVELLGHRKGLTYLVKAASRRGTKIGYTDGRLRRRLERLSVRYRTAIHCLAAFASPDPYALEAHLHHYFKHKRLTRRGEFFALSDADIASVSALVRGWIAERRWEVR